MRSDRLEPEKRTKAVSSCGLEISLGAMFLGAAGDFVAPFTLGPEIFGVLGVGEADTFSGAGPIVYIAESKEYRGQAEKQR